MPLVGYSDLYYGLEAASRFAGTLEFYVPGPPRLIG
jgi:hypothetical protein